MQFPHEKLIVYQKGLQCFEGLEHFLSSWGKQQAFLDIANAAAMKLAVYLDMGVRRAIWSDLQAKDAKQLLVRIGQMTARKGYAD